jgi:hypothetical protein
MSNKSISKKKSMSSNTNKISKKSTKSRKYSDKHINQIHQLTGINFESGSEITTKVETLTSADVNDLAGNYAIVDKADGLRCVLYLNDKNQLLKLNTKKFDETDMICKGSCKSIQNSLIDTEYIHKIKTYFIFDILIFNGKDVRGETFKNRHKLLLKFKDLKLEDTESQIKLKEYEVDYDDFHKACQKVYQKKYPYNLDGLIFTPLKGDYQSKSLKWKPLKDLTIDFIIRIRKKYVDNGKTYLILDLFNTVTRTEMYRDGLRFPKGYFDYFPMIDKSFYSVPFPFMPEYDNKHSYCIIEVNEEKELKDKRSRKSKSRLSFSGNEPITDFDVDSPNYFYKKIEKEGDKRIIKLVPIMDNCVVEMNYNVNSKDNNPARKWIPYRFRRDRTIQYWTNLYNNPKKTNRTISGPNAKKKADVIWKMYQNPITTDMMFGRKSLPKLYYVKGNIDRSHTINLTIFHIWVKEQLYETYFYYKNYTENLLELSAGDGSDAANIVKQMPGYVLMIDLVETSLTKAAIDFKKFQNIQRKYKTKLETIALDLRDDNIKKIEPFTKKNGFRKFNVVSIQFAFHYMMETKESFKNLFNLIKNYTQPGGFYFMTCFDGATVYKELKNKREKKITVEGDPDKVLYSVEKMYPDNLEFDDLDMFGTPIKVSIHTIGVNMIEYLVNFKKVVSHFKKYGFSLVDTKMFSKLAPEWEKISKRKLSEPEQAFSFLNRYAVFQRDH